MAHKRKIDIFSAGCPACQSTIDLVNDMACGSCEIEVHNMNDAGVAKRADNIGVRSVPAVVVDGELLECCKRGPTEEALENAGIGTPTS
jgi:glutaredoxin